MQLRRILFTYTDPAFANMQDHLREELIKGLLVKTQIRVLAKLMTNKLADKIMIKFLEVFLKNLIPISGSLIVKRWLRMNDNTVLRSNIGHIRSSGTNFWIGIQKCVATPATFSIYKIFKIFIEPKLIYKTRKYIEIQYWIQA